MAELSSFGIVAESSSFGIVAESIISVSWLNRAVSVSWLNRSFSVSWLNRAVSVSWLNRAFSVVAELSSFGVADCGLIENKKQKGGTQKNKRKARKKIGIVCTRAQNDVHLQTVK